MSARGRHRRNDVGGHPRLRQPPVFLRLVKHPQFCVYSFIHKHIDGLCRACHALFIQQLQRLIEMLFALGVVALLFENQPGEESAFDVARMKRRACPEKFECGRYAFLRPEILRGFRYEIGDDGAPGVSGGGGMFA